MKLDKLIKKIKPNFPYMKFELEANFDMDNSYCDTCGGDGEVENDEGDYETCYDCDGGCENESSFEDLECYIMDSLPSGARQKIVFAKAYNDGSVDTEYTFTIATEAIGYVPRIIELFREYGENNGCVNTEGAGFHIAVLTESCYPCDKQLDQAKLENFRREVTRLLPAMIHEATPNRETRAFYPYRLPRISSEKYSCVAIHNGALEYRLFDPCINEPEQVYEYIGVIANSLRYYSKRKLKANLYEKFEIGELSNHTNNLGKLFSSYDNMQALQSTLKYINPEGKLKIKTATGKRQLRLKYAKQCKLIKQYQEHIESKNRDCEQRLHRDWLQLIKAKAQAKRLADLTKITAQEYVDIERDRQYAPTTVREQIGSDGGMRLTATRFLEMYRNEFRPLAFAEFSEQITRHDQDTITITG